jgi:hypothetical protein
MCAVLAALFIVAPTRMSAIQSYENLYIYNPLVEPDTIFEPTNVTFTASVMNDLTYPVMLKHFWISISNKSGELQSFNMTYDKLDLPGSTSKTELMTVLVENLAVGTYNVTLDFGFTSVFNATENNVIPDTNVTLSVIEPVNQPQWLLYFWIGSGVFVIAIFIIGGVGNRIERKRRQRG